MKRFVGHTLITVLAGIILTGCAYDYAARDLREQSYGSRALAIAFSNGIIDNPARVTTKAAPALLSSHSSSMGVWGWQTTSGENAERLFNNQKVTFSALTGQWTYKPVKYWQMNSTYRFYAYAPHSDSTGVAATIDTTTHTMNFNGVTLRGDNTISAGVYTLPANFANVKDIDWMIDRTGQSMAGINRAEVMFNMQHILAKICLRVCRSASAQPDSLLAIRIDSVKIGRFIAQGNFSQEPNGMPIAQAAEWTTVDTLPRYEILSPHGVSVGDTAVYIIESLIIPQAIADDQYIRVWYSIGARGGYLSNMSHVQSLKNLFSSQHTHFDTGQNYIITAILGSDPITFNGGTLDWDSHILLNKM